MNKRQLEFIKILERHLVQEVSTSQLRTWLTKNIRPIAVQSAGIIRPGTWLEIYAYRTIRSHIDDLEDSTISKGANLDWYWGEITRVLDLLMGKIVFQKTEYWVEFPLNHKRRKSDEWMASHLEYVETVVQMLKAHSKESTRPDLPKPEITFKPNPLSLRTGSEIIMNEMLNGIKDYEDLIDSWTDLPNHFYSIDPRSVQLSRLEKLIRCFKGELYYSVSVTFEGFDKFTITTFIT